MKRIKLVFNRLADKGHALALENSLRALADELGDCSWSITEHPAHARELAFQAGKEGYEIVASLGGDGTLHGVVNGLMQIPKAERPLLASVPIGSGNDFSNNVGILSDPLQALQRVFEGEAKAIDVASIETDTGRQEYWINSLGVGFDAAVAIHTYEIRKLQGFAMYLWAVIQTILHNHSGPPMHISIDGEERIQETIMLTLCNGAREGGGFHVAPAAMPDDGILDYAMIEFVSRAMMFRLIPEVMNGRHGRFKQVHMGRCMMVKANYDTAMPIHFDGEIFANFDTDVRGITIRIHPAELMLRL